MNQWQPFAIPTHETSPPIPLKKRVNSIRTQQIGAGVPMVFSFQIPEGARLIKMDFSNQDSDGTDWSAELSDRDGVFSVGLAIINHVLQVRKNSNLVWEAQTDWFIRPPFSFINVLADVVVAPGNIMVVTVGYEDYVP